MDNFRKMHGIAMFSGLSTSTLKTISLTRNLYYLKLNI